jgi:hypothetical protein
MAAATGSVTYAGAGPRVGAATAARQRSSRRCDFAKRGNKLAVPAKPAKRAACRRLAAVARPSSVAWTRSRLRWLAADGPGPPGHLVESACGAFELRKPRGGAGKSAFAGRQQQQQRIPPQEQAQALALLRKSSSRLRGRICMRETVGGRHKQREAKRDMISARSAGARRSAQRSGELGLEGGGEGWVGGGWPVAFRLVKLNTQGDDLLLLLLLRKCSCSCCCCCCCCCSTSWVGDCLNKERRRRQGQRRATQRVIQEATHTGYDYIWPPCSCAVMRALTSL